MAQTNRSLNNKSYSQDYKKFNFLDGSHPWKEHVPEGYVPYKVHCLQKGIVSYFNFSLAKEMGLIDKKHPHKLNKTLQNIILDTFSIQIINEYDQVNSTPIPEKRIKPQSYMASRYLQLQHPNKQGKTSGDGRGIWNGTITHKGKTWDVSSRGTGVTKLAPGSVMSKTPLQTGSNKVGYGCGLAEIDELYSSAIMSETLYRQGYKTERVLAIIDLGNGVGIGVRAGHNLFRPAHIFMYLKQNQYAPLKRSVDYLIKRQTENGEWSFRKKTPYKYQDLLEQICKEFAQFSAWLETDYIFTWLDWDGDNVLINAGIIDYGSIRQLGLRHDQYRYDDVERWSTNLNEQKQKARHTVQVFAQLVDFLETNKRKPLKEFNDHPILKKFDQNFSYYLTDRTLFRIGFTKTQRSYLIEKQQNKVQNFLSKFHYIERYKVCKPAFKVEDGINRPPLFNMPKIIKELPSCHINSLPQKHPFSHWLSSFAKGKDKKITISLEKHFFTLIEKYHDLVKSLSKELSTPSHYIIRSLQNRTYQIHRENRLTGNALVHIVWELLAKRKKISDNEIQKIIDNIIIEQSSIPEARHSKPVLVPHINLKKEGFLTDLHELATTYNQDI